MNKTDKRLLQLAFGELSEGDTAEMESVVSNDPKLAAAVSSYASLRDDLRSLADIPDHQLSTERLRNALLNEGLKPRSEAASPWSWLWMPAASCAMVAALVMFMRPHGATPAAIVEGTQHAFSGLETPLKFPPVRMASVADSIKPHPAIAVAKKKLDEAHGALARNDVRPRDDSRLRETAWRQGSRRSRRNAADREWLKYLTTVSMQPGSEDSDTQGAPVASVPPEETKPVALKPMDNKTGESVVLIGTDKDKDTGTQSATVGSAKNVTVSG